jgi:hypothetical protein
MDMSPFARPACSRLVCRFQDGLALLPRQFLFGGESHRSSRSLLYPFSSVYSPPRGFGPHLAVNTYSLRAPTGLFLGVRYFVRALFFDDIDAVKTFGLFKPGDTEPIRIYRGAAIMLKDNSATILGEVGRNFQRDVVVVIPLEPGWTVREAK